MRTASSIAILALLASPAFAAPLMASGSRSMEDSLSSRTAPVEEEPAPAPVEEPAPAAAKPVSSGIGSAIASSAVGGAVSATVGNLLNKIESLFRRDELEVLAQRDVSAIKDVVQAIPSLSAEDKQTVKAALVNKINTLQDSEIAARGLGATLGGAVASGTASAVVGNLLSEVCTYFCSSRPRII